MKHHEYDINNKVGLFEKGKNYPFQMKRKTILHSQKSKCTIVPGTQTTLQIVFGALFEFYTTWNFQIS